MSVLPRPSTPPTATVVGGDGAMRHQIAGQLKDAGFLLGGTGDTSALVVLIAPRADADRGRMIRTLIEADPEAGVLVVMPTGTTNASLRRSLLAGARGIVFETDVRQAFVATARAVLAGQLAIPSALGQLIAPRPLSHREKQILSLVVLGLTNREIAQRLYLAESTVKTHLSSAFRKIDARSRSEAVTRIQEPDSTYGPGVLALLDSVQAPAA